MQILFNGFVSGAAVALLAAAFQAVYLPTRVFFLALGAIYALAPYVASVVLVQGVGWALAMVITAAACATLAVACEWVNHGPLARRSASEGAHLIAALGTYIVMVQVIAMVWGSDVQSLRSDFGDEIDLGPVTASDAQWIALLTAAILFAAFGLLLQRSTIGLRLRALADNPVQFALLGYNVDRHRLYAFALSGALASAASLVTAYDLGYDPYNGLHAVVLAVVAVIIGGRGSFMGPVLGAFILGILRTEVVWYSSARWQEPATFTVLAAFLLLRPSGLIAPRGRLEASV
jgi:branched-chain amino acid transport system permease protein